VLLNRWSDPAESPDRKILLAMPWCIQRAIALHPITQFVVVSWLATATR
jgi:hypothetical protein